MKTSWNELRLIEDHLLSATSSGEKILFEAQLLLQPDLQESVHWQQKTYDLVQKYGRQQLRKEIEQVQQRLFTAPEHASFKQKILRLFGQ